MAALVSARVAEGQPLIHYAGRCGRLAEEQLTHFQKFGTESQRYPVLPPTCLTFLIVG